MITPKEICDYQYKRVRATSVSGNVFEGELIRPYSEFDTDSGKIEIAIGFETYIVSIPIDEVDSLELLESNS